MAGISLFNLFVFAVAIPSPIFTQTLPIHPPLTMTDPNISKAMEHRLIPSMFNDGSFPMAWIGDTPTLDARREHIRAYLEWRLPHGDMENQERKLRDLAERKAAMLLINDNVIEVGADQFEWLIDEMLWHTWRK